MVPTEVVEAKLIIFNGLRCGSWFPAVFGGMEMGGE
jgi:hypothetical protein